MKTVFWVTVLALLGIGVIVLVSNRLSSAVRVANCATIMVKLAEGKIAPPDYCMRFEPDHQPRYKALGDAYSTWPQAKRERLRAFFMGAGTLNRQRALEINDVLRQLKEHPEAARDPAFEARVLDVQSYFTTRCQVMAKTDLNRM